MAASLLVIFVGLAALASTVYLALEASAWAVLYLWVGALPAWTPAMLYSLRAITSYGHADVYLEDRWRLLGAIEAVNGLILFGLTTAFLYAAIQQVWPLRSGQEAFAVIREAMRGKAMVALGRVVLANAHDEVMADPRSSLSRFASARRLRSGLRFRLG